MASRNFYEVLKVPRTAGPEEIQRAYRALVRRYHPDVSKESGAEDRFKEITEAYEVLTDPDRRCRYDRFGRQGPPDRKRWGGGTTFRTGPGGRAGRRIHVNAGPFPRAGSGSGQMHRSGLLGEMFSGGRGPLTEPMPGPGPGPGRQTVIELGVEDAYRGGRHLVALDTPRGRRTYEVDIPAGVTDGQRIRLAATADPRSPAGDLYLVVRLAVHPLYRVEGRDITVVVPVTPSKAARGGSIAVPTPDGEVRIKLPAGSRSGRRLRLRGRGLPNPAATPGDLYAEIEVMDQIRRGSRGTRAGS